MHLSPTVALILGILGGALEVVQEVVITMSPLAHSITAFALIVVLAFGVVPLSKEALGRLIPAHVAAFLTAAAGILAGAQTQFNISGLAHSIILYVLAIFAAIGIVPSVLPTAETKRSLVAAGKVPAQAIATLALMVALGVLMLALALAV